ncbi:MAG: hypothetical protein WDZ35_15665 [Crocinitomicaceae bacterium]
MNAKTIFFTLLLAISSSLTASAQEGASYDAENCAKYRSLYYQYLKQGMYQDACNFWTMAYNYCGGADSLDVNFFINGKIAFSKLQKETKDEAKSAELNDSIVWIYEQRLKSSKDADWALDYAVFRYANKMNEDMEKLDELFKNVHILKSKASATQVTSYFLHLLTNKFNNAPKEKKDEVRSFIIDEYLILSEYLTEAAAKAEKEKIKQSYVDTQDFLDKYFVKIADNCEVLMPVFEKKYEALPEDKEEAMETLNKFIALMERQKCTDSETYAKYVKKSVEMNPTAAGHFGLGNVQLSKNQTSEAIKSFEKAVEMEADGENKDKYVFNLANAQLEAHQYSTAFRTAKQVGGDYKGKAMIIAGNAISATANSCGESTFDRKANYWLANDYYSRAASMGENVSSSRGLSSAPTDTEIFQAGKSKGESITLSCWGESTTVR